MIYKCDSMSLLFCWVMSKEFDRYSSDTRVQDATFHSAIFVQSALNLDDRIRRLPHAKFVSQIFLF